MNFEIRRALHDTTLGMDQLSSGSNIDTEKLVSALRGFVHLPLADDGNGDELTHITNLVLLGESTHESIFNEALKTVLGEQYA